MRANTKCPAVHTPYINPKLNIVNEILILNSMLLATYLFSPRLSFLVFIILSYDFPNLSFNRLLILHTY
jgi:hypothetical protein